MSRDSEPETPASAGLAVDRDLEVAPVPRLSAALAAIEQIRELIQDGTLKPGDRLPSERRLGEMLGVSRPTVREALSALALLDVVETRKGSGSVVGSLDLETLSPPLNVVLALSQPSDRNVESLLELRAVVESGLARLAATRISDEALREYEARLQLLHAAETDAELLRHDIHLHELIHREANSPLMVWLLDSFRDLFALGRSRTVVVAGVKDRVAADQDLIFDALSRRDPDAAYLAMWRHIVRILDAYRARPADEHPAEP